MARRRKIYGLDELNPAERAWLTGEGRDTLEEWDEFFLWSLEHGFASHHEGRSITAVELLAQFRHLVPDDRIELLELQAKRCAKYSRNDKGNKADVVSLKNDGKLT